MSSEWWAFVRQTGLKSGEIVFLLIGLFLFGNGVPLALNLWRLARPKITRRLVASTLSAFASGAFLLLVFFLLVRERYLLRPGAGHYTVGTVYQHKWWKSRQNYLVEYFVAG